MYRDGQPCIRGESTNLCNTNDYEYRPPGVPRSIASTSGSDLFHVPDAAPSRTWPEEANVAASSAYITKTLGPMRLMCWPRRSTSICW
ncbi:unnamed protein product [Dibothriocephalus latus]|uniref:Uncharacterized protein n=1 Tax=Dibothriocephalus latus TaxID=60516 RepID=A0A3P7LZS3_DIBLA|nr:unnamed protein product [Dibothriocephalus latus]